MTGRAETRKYHYFYKIVNNVNGHFYYGVHNTDNLEDGYMGSGKRLQYAYKKYGIENFSKEIIKFFNTSKEAFEYEAEIVTESLVKENSCYNCEVGGIFIDTTGFVPVKDKDGNKFLVSTGDTRFKNGEVVSVIKGTTIVKDEEGNKFRVPIEDNRFLSGKLKSFSKGTMLVKDSAGKYFMVPVNDERVKSGNLKMAWSGRKHTEETIEKIKFAFKESGHQKGKKNSQYGTCWVNDGSKNKKIKKNDLQYFLENGWSSGRLIGPTNTVWITNNAEQKSTYVKKENVEWFLENGWVIGRKFFKDKQ